ncbi:DDE_3 domain-containing protein [Trichonephila clavipes]|uniref:DDE_3 domain-containing protein n=1 Tax=Trichonephila clavipes TaxID=2585209 RepID=A0A8X6S4X9_TRICX|nr:DDE_3 domain-containing protein [Trichonephila clavipes]
MRGTLTGQRYVDDILRPHVGPFLNGLPGAIFQQDNARPHTARVTLDFLRHFQTLPWPTHYPDLSPVVHVWDQLKRQMPSCHSVHDLELAVQDLWAHLPQDNIRCLINSMPAGGGTNIIREIVQSMFLSIIFITSGKNSGERLRESGQPIGRLRKTCKKAVPGVKTYKSEEQHAEVVFKTIENHLVMFVWNFKKYFLAEDNLIASYEWVRDSFHNTSEGLSTAEEEIFVDFTFSGIVIRQF